MLQNKNQEKHRHILYSPKTLMIRSLLGVFLMALGVTTLLSLFPNMEGLVFSFLNVFIYGLGGSLGFLIPLFIIWIGVLLAFSGRKPIPIFTFSLSVLLYVLILSFIIFVTNIYDKEDRTSYSLMAYISRINTRDLKLLKPDSFLNFIKQIFILSSKTHAGGGVLGMMLAWPLENTIGRIPAVLLLPLIILTDMYFISRLDIGAIIFNIKQRRKEKLQLYAEHEKSIDDRWQQEEVLRYKREQKKYDENPQDSVMLENIRDMASPPTASSKGSIFSSLLPRSMRFKNKVQNNSKIDAYSLKHEDMVTSISSVPTIRVNKKTNPPAELYDEILSVDLKPTKEINLDKSIHSSDIPMEIPNNSRDNSIFKRPIKKESEENIISTKDTSSKIKSKASEKLEQIKIDDYLDSKLNSNLRVSSSKPLSKNNIVINHRRPVKKATHPLPLNETTPYIFPSLKMLNPPFESLQSSHEDDQIKANILQETLQSFGITGHIKNITKGPAITRFELDLDAGINVKRITSISDNIALSMATNGVRIEAPIPGKSLIGIEIPNKEIHPVVLREVLGSREMKRAKSPLSVALGKDIAGSPIICDLATMPHLLIAGATGSGKSVCINSIINSIIYRCSPDDVKMVLIDPKVVELQGYNDIPHLILPVISDPYKAASALNWTVNEMMERYEKFTDLGVRNISGYNSKISDDIEQLPYMVIVIDELADLMMVSKKDVEEYICRLAQLARAAGIHLVVATQRPSVDVITGLIKANIPSRIAFAVSSNIDSRTILDAAGAEKLLGRGDMLYSPSGSRTPIRVQGCFVSDDEVIRVTNFIRANSKANYNPDVIEQIEQDNATASNNSRNISTTSESQELDPLLIEAIEMAVEDGQTSISMLQRRLRIGYARAGRIVDEMTRRGIISQAAGAKPREVLMTKEEIDSLNIE